MGSLLYTTRRGTLKEFLETYERGTPNGGNAAGGPLLHYALSNHEAANRAAISSLLLEEGADVTWQDRRDGTNLLHVLLTHVRSTFTDTDMALLHRLLDGGADVNASAKGFGTPLQLLRRYAGQGETNVLPVYEVLFARDDLDLFNPGKYGHSTYSSAWKTRESKPILWQRVQQYIADHGLQVPDSERVEE